MEKKKFSKNDIIVLCLRMLGVFFLIAGILFFCVKFNDDYNHDLEFEVGIASPTDEFYTIEIEGGLDNHTNETISGTLNVKFEDTKGKIATATFENITLLGKSELEIDKINKSVTTDLFDEENGLNYDMKIVKVTIGNIEFLDYSSRPVVALPLLIVGIGIMLIVQLVVDRQNKIRNTQSEENTIDMA